MQLQDLKPKFKTKKKKRVGHGGRRGTHCGRGISGQGSRGSRKLQPAIRELIKRYPKLRGYRFKSIKGEIAVLNLEILDKMLESSEEITPQKLVEKNIISKINGKIPQVKILGEGEISKKIILKGFVFSKSAKEKIEKAGGHIEGVKEEVKAEVKEEAKKKKEAPKSKISKPKKAKS
ncbi:MAG: uL15 family ribosomal protein [Candidatus Pacebacteria bacterium]|nr:uL15 family ribosomal protein [Candidatus Paceibacterota bacterium]